MTRHLMVTSVIIAAVMVGVTWLNDGRFELQRVGWSTYNNYVEMVGIGSIYKVKIDATITEPLDEPVRTAEAIKPTIPTDGITGTKLAGIAVDIDLRNHSKLTEQIRGAWQLFTSKSALHNAVNWSGNSTEVYAYYYEFNDDFNQGRLLIGYQQAQINRSREFTRAEVKSGQQESFSMATGILPAEAWNVAYPNGVIVEKYRMDMNGKVEPVKAWVIK